MDKLIILLEKPWKMYFHEIRRWVFMRDVAQAWIRLNKDMQLLYTFRLFCLMFSCVVHSLMDKEERTGELGKDVKVLPRCRPQAVWHISHARAERRQRNIYKVEQMSASRIVVLRCSEPFPSSTPHTPSPILPLMKKFWEVVVRKG